MINLTINQKSYEVALEEDMPLLWVLRDELQLTGTKFGCGKGLCGACTIHVDGQALRSCVTPIGAVKNKAITTIEGLSNDGLSHPLQEAWIAEQVPQCGYCQSAQIMAAAAFLATNPAPSLEEIRNGITNLCRCGTYARIHRAVQRAANIHGHQHEQG